ncbi:MAG TPA: hypothetical protein VGG39_11985 [Polyangiaceae bacterium]|jgi:hypothetical protein
MTRGTLAAGIATGIATVGLALASITACGSAPPDATTAVTGSATNPDGVPYPSPASGYGRTARSGSTPGSVIQNFAFVGYPALTGNGAVPSSPSTISLADYYDPCGKRTKMIHLSVAGVWCEACNEETDAVVAANAQLVAQGIVVLQALDDGPTEGVPATLGDLGHWVENHGSNFPEMLDPGLQNLGGFFPAAAIPWNADIDPRTMEIVDSNEGWSGDVAGAITTSVLPADPSYPIPASANCE